MNAMIEAFIGLMHLREADHVVWVGPQSDLVELTHIMWRRDMVLDCYGRPVTYRSLIKNLCEVLHIPCPKNPTAVLNNISNRKFSTSSLYCRCAIIMKADGSRNPLERFVMRREEG